jgi:hypothetical protein
MVNGKSKVIFPTDFEKCGYEGKKLKRKLGKILICTLSKYNILV